MPDIWRCFSTCRRRRLADASLRDGRSTVQGARWKPPARKSSDLRRDQPLVHRGPCRSMLRHFFDQSGGKNPCRAVASSVARRTRAGDKRYRSLRRGCPERLRQLGVQMDRVRRSRCAASPNQPVTRIGPCGDEDFDGVCHACDVLFTSPRHQERTCGARFPKKIRSLKIQEEKFS